MFTPISEEDALRQSIIDLYQPMRAELSTGLSLRNKLTTTAGASVKVVVMPDFYLDYIISFPGRFEDMVSILQDSAKRGGGNLLGWTHTLGRGGKACNLASQLASLGATATPIFETDHLGRALLSNLSPSLDLSHVKTEGRLSRTVSIETTYSGRHVNLMISDPGTLQSFGPEKLSEEDRELIRSSDYVCLVSWNQNTKGTELAEDVFKSARKGHAITFFDPGDVSTRKGEIQGLNDRILTQGLVDVLSVNEEELVQLASAMREGEIVERGESSLFEAASVFSMLGSRVDLHTTQFSATFIDGQRVRAPCLKLEPSKVTGAGDVWNAGDVYAQARGLDHKERLTFANATAAAYLSKTSLEPVLLDEILGMVDRIEKEPAANPASTETKVVRRSATKSSSEEEADDDFGLGFDLSEL